METQRSHASLWICCTLDGSFREIAESATRTQDMLDLVETVPGLTLSCEDLKSTVDCQVKGEIPSVLTACEILAGHGHTGYVVDLDSPTEDQTRAFEALGFLPELTEKE